MNKILTLSEKIRIAVIIIGIILLIGIICGAIYYNTKPKSADPRYNDSNEDGFVNVVMGVFAFGMFLTILISTIGQIINIKPNRFIVKMDNLVQKYKDKEINLDNLTKKYNDYELLVNDPSFKQYLNGEVFKRNFYEYRYKLFINDIKQLYNNPQKPTNINEIFLSILNEYIRSGEQLTYVELNNYVNIIDSLISSDISNAEKIKHQINLIETLIIFYDTLYYNYTNTGQIPDDYTDNIENIISSYANIKNKIIDIIKNDKSLNQNEIKTIIVKKDTKFKDALHKIIRLKNKYT